MELQWTFGDQSGSFDLQPGENHIILPTAAGKALTRPHAEMNVPPADKMFFNGYQTWTYSPEHSRDSRIRGMHYYPRAARNWFALDRFGDYHFVTYPYRRGMFHGVSYCYFRDGETYRLFGSLDEQPGYTLFSYDVRKECLKIERDCAGVAAAGDTFHAFDLFYAEGSEDEVFDGWFDAMGIHNAPPPVNGYSSWYNHYQKINEKTISDDLQGAARVFSPGDLFQIDDGWESRVGDWTIIHERKVPHGLKPIADSIHLFRPGSGWRLLPVKSGLSCIKIIPTGCCAIKESHGRPGSTGAGFMPWTSTIRRSSAI